MPEFTSRSEKDAAGLGAARTCLPGLDLKFIEQRAVAGKADRTSIALKAAPPFNGRALAAGNPFAFWAQAARSAQRPSTRRVAGGQVEACAAATGRRPRSPRNAGQPAAARLSLGLERLG
jgi:hypothetical protein